MEKCFNCGEPMFVLYKTKGKYNLEDIVVHWKCPNCDSERVTYE